MIVSFIFTSHITLYLPAKQLQAKYLDYAHQILALSEGQIKSAATYGELLQDGVSEFFTTASANELEDARATDFDTTRAGQKAKRKSTHEDSKSLSAESSRAMGEWNTYKYYFRSVGWKHGSLFFFMTLLSSFFLTFGSEWCSETILHRDVD